MVILLWLLFLIVPFLVGIACFKINRSSLAEAYINGTLLCILLIEAIHLIGFIRNLSIFTIAQSTLVLFGIVVMLSIIVILWKLRKNRNLFKIRTKEPLNSMWYPFVLFIIVLIEVLTIYSIKSIEVPGDIMVETVNSFLQEDGIYTVHPLTGQAFRVGMPFRYKMLCLPTFYTLLCKGWSLEADVLVKHLIPIFTLVLSYLVFFRFSKTLFGKKTESRFLFLIIISLLVLFGEQSRVMDGYGLMHAGYLGTTIRNMVLMPYTLCMSLEKKWSKAILCIVVEASITWTFYGLGYCVLITSGIFLLFFFLKIREGKQNE